MTLTRLVEAARAHPQMFLKTSQATTKLQFVEHYKNLKLIFVLGGGPVRSLRRRAVEINGLRPMTANTQCLRKWLWTVDAAGM